MEIKIGVKDTPREIVLESKLTQDEVQDVVSKALAGESSLLSLEDEKGRRVFVPSALIAYVEIAQADTRRVGFAS